MKIYSLADPDLRYHRHAFTEASYEDVQAQVWSFQRAAAAKEYIFIPM